MSGKAYTMKEMKTIVEYLTEKKAYDQLRGRKMWVDFSNTQLTVRTWQSLKETFLKRILPDIHNPYYKLTTEEIRSFKEGCDVAAKEKNKLEIVNLDDDSNSNSNAENEVDKEQPTTSNANNGETITGEDVICSKVESDGRDSVDTVIIPTCYETAEDVQRALESPRSDKEMQSNSTSPQPKSLRDLITYSEPLTPMLQEVLDDFATDSDSSEMRMQIVDNPPDSDPQVVAEDPPAVIRDSEDVITKDNVDPKENNSALEDFVHPKISALKLKKRKGGYTISKSPKKSPKEDEDIPAETVEAAVSNEAADNTSEQCNAKQNHIDEKQDKALTTIPEKITPDKSTQNLSNSTDTILPNNQEALEKSVKNKRTNNEKDIENEIQINKEDKKVDNVVNKSKTRKRAISQDVTTTSKIDKKLLGSKATTKEKSVSDTDTIKKKMKKSKSTISKTNFVNLTKQVDPEKLTSENGNGNTKEKSKIDCDESGNKEENNSTIDLSQQNPCLKSVSLFAEQFNQDSYILSESDHEPSPSQKSDNKKEKESNKKDDNDVIMNEVVVLKSRSESESEKNEISPNQTKMNKQNISISNSQRNKILADMFGFSSGAVGTSRTKRKKSTSYKKHPTYRCPRHEANDDSSEWTSESDSREYVSPPRGRKNRQTRKYLKPNSARILSLEEEGGLFVMYGKKLYPLVKDGKIIKNYLNYLPESDSEEEESYWKLKYVEERQRVEELKKIVVENQKKNATRDKSPILHSKSLRNISLNNEQRSPAKPQGVRKTIMEQETIPIPAKGSNEVNDKGNTLKITFAKNNQEVHLEGHWSNIHPVLAEVVNIFNNDTDAPRLSVPEANGNVMGKRLSDASSDHAVSVVPVDTEVHEKVNKLETEILKDIMERDKEEMAETKEPDYTKEPNVTKDATDENVTKRKRAPRNKRSSSSLSSAQNSSASSSRSAKQKKTTDANNVVVNTESPKNEDKPEKETAKPSRKSTAKKIKKTEQKTKESDKGEQKTADAEAKTAENNKEISKPDENNKEASKADENNKETSNPDENNKEASKADENNKEALKADETKSRVMTRRQSRTPKKTEEGRPGFVNLTNGNNAAVTPSSTSRLTRKTRATLAEASSSTQDDDQIRYMFSPAKKPKVTKSAASMKTRRKRYVTETPKIYSSPNISLQSESTQGYQDSDISPPKAVPRRKRKLSLTTAMAKIRHRSYRNKRKSYPVNIDDVSKDSNSSFRINRLANENSSLKSDVYRSESYQHLFPQCKSLLIPLERIDEDHPMISNRQRANLKKSTILNSKKYTLDVNMNNDFGSSSNANSSNISLPLSPEISIVENLSVSKDLLKSLENHPTLNKIHTRHVTSEIHDKYLMSQVDVSMPLMQQECNLRQSLNTKNENNFDETMRSAMSESLLNKINTVNIEDACSLSESLDTRLRNLLLESAKKMETDNNKVASKKIKSGKRCSTPRKKKDVERKKLKLTEPVVEEEYMESCSYGGRQSCPPAIQVITEENICKENIDVNIDYEADVNVINKNRVRRKKDVIKVKILRPKSKTREKYPKEREDTPLHNDNGINESESVICNHFNDSIDLIHNHSETCLHANECLPDSVEFIETASRSIISLSTDTSNDVSADSHMFKDCEALELFCSNAQDCTNVTNVQIPSKTTTEISGESVYHSPILSETSLITNDLSNESPSNGPSKWYLLSDDETTAHGAPSNSFGANLKQIFPVACAVPNLSTITEMSENSRKPTLDSDTSTRQD